MNVNANKSKIRVISGVCADDDISVLGELTAGPPPVAAAVAPSQQQLVYLAF